MKKIYHAFALLAALSIVSCVENEEFGGGEVNLSENGIAFRFNSVQTKSADLSTPVEAKTGVMLPLGKDNTGADLFLTETLTDLNALSPMTKGSPVYNENVLSLEGYGSIGATTYIKGQSTAHTAGNANFESINEEGTNGWLYAHEYTDSPWPKDMTQDLYFFLQLPAGNVGASGFVYGSSDGTIQFDYESPTTAAEQKDILFTSRTLNKKQYLEDYQSKGLGAPVYFDHVLTGVKFRSGSNNDNQTKTIITGVKFENLYGTGTCVVNPEATGDTPKVTWSDWDNLTDFTEDGFTNPDYVKADGAENSDGTVNYIKDDGGTYTFGDSWYASGNTGRPFNTKNVNLEDGSLTFWFIPQAIPSNAKLTVSFVIKTPDTVDGVPFEHVIDLGTLLAGVEWKAGQLRTYTLDPKEVDVTITDQMTADTKSNLHISNTGNVDEFVRMLVIGNWYDKDGNIVVGYQYESKDAAVAAGHPEDPMVLPWYRGGYPCKDGVYYISEDEAKAAGWNKTDGYADPYGEFDDSFTLGSLGTRDGKRDDWADASGGYYYTMPIGPGAGVGVQSATKDLFESYTVTNVPDIYVATVGNQRELAQGVHLVMEIVVQAIAVPADADTWWLQAWYDATKIKKLDPEDLKSDGTLRNGAYVALYENGEYAPAEE